MTPGWSPKLWLAAAVLLAAGAAAVRLSRVDEPARAPSAAADRASKARTFWEDYRRATDDRLAGRLAAAMESYDAALGQRPTHEDSLYYRGNCAADLGRYAEALDSYRRLIEINPTSARGHMQTGLLQASLEEGPPLDLAAAAAHFRTALTIDPDSGGLLALGELAVLEARWEDAARTLRQVSAGDAMSVAAPYLLGFLSWRAGRAAEAQASFRTAVGRGEIKKPAVRWTEEGDVKADPALRWQALARQTITGRYWIRTRAYRTNAPGPAQVSAEYERLSHALSAFEARAHGVRPDRSVR